MSSINIQALIHGERNRVIIQRRISREAVFMRLHRLAFETSNEFLNPSCSLNTSDGRCCRAHWTATSLNSAVLPSSLVLIERWCVCSVCALLLLSKQTLSRSIPRRHVANLKRSDSSQLFGVEIASSEYVFVRSVVDRVLMTQPAY